MIARRSEKSRGITSVRLLRAAAPGRSRNSIYDDGAIGTSPGRIAGVSTSSQPHYAAGAAGMVNLPFSPALDKKAGKKDPVLTND
jgi:hypothetical protein